MGVSSRKKDDNNKTKYNYYAVTRGHVPGIYDNWHNTKATTNGYSGNTFQGFQTKRQAESFMRSAGISNPTYYIATQTPASQEDEVGSSFNDTSILPSNSSTPTRTDRLIEDNAARTGCQNCEKLMDIINSLTKRLDKLEQAQAASIDQSSQADKFKSISLELQSICERISAIDKRLEDSRKPDKAATTSKERRSYATATGASINATSDIKTTENKASKEAVNNRTKFNPAKCIVISNIDKEHLKQLNQDKIRRELSKKFGPVMIDLVNRYKPNGPNPRLIIQLAKESVVENVLSQWDSSLFGGSTARKTIKPNTFIGMIKGVPLDIPDDDIKSSLEGTSDIYRMKMANGTLLHTVKVTFTDKHYLDKALADGMLMEEHNILCRIERPYDKSTSNNG